MNRVLYADAVGAIGITTTGVCDITIGIRIEFAL